MKKIICLLSIFALSLGVGLGFGAREKTAKAYTWAEGRRFYQDFEEYKLVGYNIENTSTGFLSNWSNETLEGISGGVHQANRAYIVDNDGSRRLQINTTAGESFFYISPRGACSPMNIANMLIKFDFKFSSNDFGSYENGWIGISVRKQACYAKFDAIQNAMMTINSTTDNTKLNGRVYEHNGSSFGEITTGTFQPLQTTARETWHTAQFYANGNNLELYVDGYLIAKTTTGVTNSGFIALNACNTTVFIDNFEVVDTSLANVQPTVAREKMEVPTAGTNSFEYTGSEITYTPAGFDSAKMSISGNKETNAGSYTATVSIKDTSKYCWADNSLSDRTISWSITPKAIAIPTAGTNSFEYTGSVITYMPAGFDSDIMTISGNTGTEINSYAASVGLKSANYKWSDNTTGGKPLNWYITVKAIEIPAISGNSSFEYTGSEITLSLSGFDADIMDISYNVQTNVGNYTAVVTLKDSHDRWTDGTATVQLFNWSITPKKVALPTAPAQTSFEETGSVITFTPVGFDETLMDITGNTGASANDYVAIVSLKDINNYVWTDNTVDNHIFHWSITSNATPTPIPTPTPTPSPLAKTQVAIPEGLNENKIFYYTGSEITYIPVGFDSNVMAIYDNVATEIGEEYIAVVHLKDTDNYEWADGTTGNLEFKFSIRNEVTPTPTPTQSPTPTPTSTPTVTPTENPTVTPPSETPTQTAPDLGTKKSGCSNSVSGAGSLTAIITVIASGAFIIKKKS